MEDEILNGKEVKDIFMKTSFVACKKYNLTVTQVSLAVVTLTDVWKYGEELRVAWNEKFENKGVEELTNGE